MPRFLALMLIGGVVSGGLAQPISGDVAVAGFPAGSVQVFREGQWLPIQVNLSAQGSEFVECRLRVMGIDLDGDRVAYSTGPLVVEPDTRERVWCYAVANALDDLPAGVDVLSSSGALITRLPLPAQPLGVILNDDLLVLDISSQRIVRLDRLRTEPWSPGEYADGYRDYYRNVVVASMPAADLPDRWWGLEAVDVVVWDRPDQSEIHASQLDALVQWVRNGGQLVVGVGGGWEAIRKKTALAEIMPLEGEAETVEVTRLWTFFDRMALFPGRTLTFDGPVELTTAKRTADAVRTLGEYDAQHDAEINLITMRLVGSGRVVATAAGLRDLLSVPINFDRFFGEIIDLNPYTEKFKEKQQDSIGATLTMHRPLSREIVPEISFRTGAAVGGLTAFLFVVAYIALATLATWWWLVRQKRAHLSWVAFGVCAVFASGLSLLTVYAARGVLSRGVKTLCIADLEAGSSAARGPCLIGYASPRRVRADLSLAGEGDFLRPLPRGLKLKSHYVTPARYAGVPTRARLDDVLVRATLKQLEGFWHGELSGTIRGNLVVGRDGRITPGSWLANELDVDLQGGYLLFLDPRHPLIAVRQRAAGLTTVYDDPNEFPVVPPACNVLVVALPPIRAGERVAAIGAAHYADVDRRLNTWRTSRVASRAARPDLATLWQTQYAWNARYIPGVSSGPPPIVRSLLLASTHSFHLNNDTQEFGKFDRLGTPITTEGLPDLEISHWLLYGRAVLLAWADDPGPVRLHRAGEPLRPSGGLTLYRVRVPIVTLDSGTQRGPER